jgi:hypothetical protein
VNSARVRSRSHTRSREGHTNLRSSSSDKLVLMDEATEEIVPSNPLKGRTWKRIRLRAPASSGRDLDGAWPRCSEWCRSEAPAPGVASAEHEHPVQTLGPDRANPPFGERVRSRGPDRRLDDDHSFGPEDLVEGTGELGVPVPDQEPDALKAAPPLPGCRLAG